MVTRNEAFPSRFYKAADLPREGKVVIIAKLEFETIGTDRKQKCVLYFRHDEKLVLNATNWDLIAVFAGADSDEWVGEKVEIFTTTTTFGGKIHDCIRVRRPRSPTAPSQPRGAPPTPDSGSLTPPPDEPGDPGY
jgi:hypothetical protein